MTDDTASSLPMSRTLPSSSPVPGLYTGNVGWSDSFHFPPEYPVGLLKVCFLRVRYFCTAILAILGSDILGNILKLRYLSELQYRQRNKQTLHWVHEFNMYLLPKNLHFLKNESLYCLDGKYVYVLFGNGSLGCLGMKICTVWK